MDGLRGVLVAVALYVGIGGLLFPFAGWDDSYITYWAAHALAEFGEIVNYNGDRVEQSSSLAQVVLLALLHRITGVEISILGHATSILLGLLAVLATARLARRVDPGATWFAPALAASSAYFLYWSFSGMETSLAALAGVLMLTAGADLLRSPRPAIAWLAFTCTALVYLGTRPETTYVLVACVAGLAVLHGLDRRGRAEAGGAARRWPWLAAGVAVAVACLVGFRLAYFGSAFPQPVSAKVQGVSLASLTDGLLYVGTAAASDFAALLALAGIGAALVLLPWRVHAQSGAGLLCGLFVVANVGFAVCSGGDFMPGGRFFVPSLPVAALLAVCALHRMLAPRFHRPVFAVWIGAQIAGVLFFATVHSRSSPLWALDGPIPDRFHAIEQGNHDHRRYFEALPELEALLDEHRPADGSPLVLFSGQCGFLMYHVFRERFGTLRLLDRFAVTTPDFAECPLTADVRRGRVGVQLAIPDYFEMLDALEQECGIPKPDVFFDITWRALPDETRAAVDRAGYDIVYEQAPAPPNPSRLLPGRRVPGRPFFAVPRQR